MTKLSQKQIIQKIFNEEESSLNVTTVESSGATQTSLLDMEQIFKAIYNEETQTIRVSEITPEEE